MKMTQTQQEKDTVDINLTPQELQILSELDRYIILCPTNLYCFSHVFTLFQPSVWFPATEQS